MKKLHFYKAKCRIGMVNPPWGYTELNLGVEEGPDAIASSDFLSDIGNPRVTEFQFPEPQNVESLYSGGQLEKAFLDFIETINTNIEPGETQVMLGGDHSATFGSVPALLRRVDDPAKIGYLQIDSHPDILLYKESSTKNFHGMYFRALVSEFDIPALDALCPAKIKPENVWFIGNLDFEGVERKTFTDFGIKNSDTNSIRTVGDQFYKNLEEFVSQYEYLHLSLDIDGLHKSIAPATGIPAEDGLKLEELYPILDIVFKHPNLSFDLVEVNPRREGAEQTIRLAQDILRKLAR